MAPTREPTRTRREVGAHTSHISHVIPHVIGNHRGVPVIIFRDSRFYLTDQVGPNVRSFGEDASPHPGKEGDGTSPERKTREQGDGVVFELSH
jgi:hypothetical protein